ncbi:RNA polymerase factor sigma-70 [Glaciimonas sp. CA11.2]|uniref:RNA polymerase factor sigma-70 n=1 Tax=unclassified Glaciimonas TaxID=2644401 RepID=UPI002AB37197|nr:MULTISPECIES: RNA polymerase factor sigma-70 [unclassified Glaciimonas]MDY7547440.1 RNA polymerase factor sigma-70 [Glaciimonas sp. CA11.2]MEB0013545.1 RNA polymerase factor sigma-70 [Glaciimonas sp. Cout2]MEB0084661.1 RNA polymerase factor sigma-70 [Glaciimonas sp. Gout2]MEB0162769.1 RNA polymerase factor sigma-70 [Glaciimonas sp. CA11.2]
MGTSRQPEANNGSAEVGTVLIANRNLLVNIATGITGCRCRAEDVVQDVFIKVSEGVALASVRQPLAYLMRMVRNLAIDHYRRRTFERRHTTNEEEGYDVPSPHAGPEASVILRDMLQHVSDALSTLPKRTRTAFEMVRIGDCTLQETARELKVSQTLVHFMVRDATTHCLNCVQGAHALLREPSVACRG